MTPRTPMRKNANHASPEARRGIRKSAAHTPREHGFWVLLGLSLSSALLRTPSWAAFSAALAMAFFSIVGAVLVGRRIRKNIALQIAASVLIAATILPIVFAGGAPLDEGLALAGPLAVAYVAGTLCVSAILERARKAPLRSRVAGLSSTVFPATAATFLYFHVSPFVAFALLITTMYTGAVLALRPPAKKLKFVGISISFAHALTAVLLILRSLCAPSC